MKNQKTSRRNFLMTPLQKKELERPETEVENNNSTAKVSKIKMLTADGKLVEVNSSALDNQPKKKRTKNQEILRWMEEAKNK
ncbi:MAG: hypothetical protein HKN76_18460 [Saprospiraceae bacterium]|nr:hypothetical protein [Saprospiraceae bacterium]